MQVISGKYKRRKLVFTKNIEVRPTKQIVKESVFNIIQGRIEGARFLDLCAGSGSMGIEALSRGASYACFVDLDIRYIQRNLEFVEEPYDVKRGRAESYLKYCKESFDIIFFDPPYDRLDIYEKSLKLIFDFDILKSDGILVCEFRSELTDLFNQYAIDYQT